MNGLRDDKVVRLRLCSIRKLRSQVMLGIVFTGLLTASALAQTAGTTTPVIPGATAVGPAKAIGPAPANSPQQQTLNSALSSQTRETLQEAMNSHPADLHPASAAK